ncbi:TVP38/TMEM64 family protein [Pueribacillus sp. YX66]|uniref:TVP38/TMEM64 family protein n=1 Tax=Pueribacillus sp. YX66 TaxID=3229242 RepID=UPI00358D8A70
MDLELLRQALTEENIKDFLEQYRALGPLPGILLPFLEALLPFLPLFIFVAGNALVYGFLLGFLYSWIGASLGSIFVFFIIRKFARHRLIKYAVKYEKLQSTMNWFERRGFGAVFLLYCFPFTPSALVNVVAGFSQMNPISFILAVSMGKMVMILIVSYIGHDFFGLLKSPVELIIVCSLTFLLWVGGKFLEIKLKDKSVQQKVKKSAE